MFNFRVKLMLVSLLLMLTFCISAAYAKSSEFKVTTLIAEISQPVDENGTLIIRLFSSASDSGIPIIIDPDTKIESNGNRLNISELEIGFLVEISAFFSSEGIVAKKVDVQDGRLGQFRFRGAIESVALSGDETVITLLGVEVTIKPNTRIKDRIFGNDRLADELNEGELADVRGRVINNLFVAKRIEIGKRKEGRIDLEGIITQTDGNQLTVNTRSGVNLIVIINPATKIRGNLIVGALVEVEGFLNQELKVNAKEIKVESNSGSGDDDSKGRNDDDNRQDNSDSNNDDRNRSEFFLEVSLTNTVANSAIEGKVKFKHKPEDGRTQQEFEVEIEDAQIDTTYGITVNFGDGSEIIDSMTTNRFGNAETEFNETQLAGKDVRDIQKVEITLDGQVVLKVNF